MREASITDQSIYKGFLDQSLKQTMSITCNTHHEALKTMGDLERYIKRHRKIYEGILMFKTRYDGLPITVKGKVLTVGQNETD